MTNRFRTWGDAGVFLAVVREGSTLAASRLLGMSQNTVARRIDELEARLGLCLFERDTRGFRPSAAATALIQAAEAIEAAAEAFEAEATALCPARRATVRLTASEAAFTMSFSRHLGRFLDENPDVRVDLISTDHKVDLAAGEADIALRHVPRPDDDRLHWERVGADPFTIFASEEYLVRNGRPVSVAEVRNHPLVLFRQGNHRAMFPALADHPRVVSNGDTVRASIAAIRSGIGIGPLPVYVARNEEGLVPCFDPPPGAEHPTWVATSKAARRRPEVRRFAAYVAEITREFYESRAQTPTSGPTQ